MSADPSDHEVPDEAYEDLLARCLERFDTGGTQAVDQLLEAHPDRAARIREALQKLHGSGLLQIDAPEEFPSSMGEFRLLRRLGGGGMGVVFLARQVSLGRDVALKIVRPDYLYFANAKKRFRREVQAVSRLQHPGIVPVWHVGEENGLPYFAMEYVPGCSLAEMLDRARARRSTTSRPFERRGQAIRDLLMTDEGSTETSGTQLFSGTWEQACVRITLRVAEAMCHAHEQQIIHRDIKPSNVMITADGQVKVVDFGLASLETGLETDEKLTKTNAVLGSLHYMAPEQVRNEAIDHRVDVYALGVTLYELLSLEAPFDGTDPAGLREAILHGAAPPLRHRMRNISRDTETVCETAMASRRDQRYPTMGALADDLRNLLELRPIHAQPPGIVRRTTRWVQRHAMLSMTLLLLVVLVAGFSGLWWQQRTANAQLRHEQEKLSAANARAATNLDRAREAIDTMLTRIANTYLSVLPQTGLMRQRVLRDALALYEEMAADDDGPELQVMISKVEQQLGGLRRRSGDPVEAGALLTRAVERVRRVAGRLPEATRRLELGRALVCLSGQRLAQKQGPEARAAIEEALALLEPALQQAAVPEEHLDELGTAYRQSAAVYGEFSDLEALGGRRGPEFERLWIEVRERAAREHPDDRGTQLRLAEARQWRGSRLLDEKEHARAIEVLEDAERIYRRWQVDEHNATDNTRSAYARCLANIARGYEASGKPGTARGWREREVEVRRLLAETHPTYPEFDCDLGGALHNLANLQFLAGELQAADANLTAALAAQERALARVPQRHQVRLYMCNHLGLACRLYYRLGRYAEVERAAGRLPEFDPVRGRGLMDGASFLMHAWLGYAGKGPVKAQVPGGATRCRTKALELLEAAGKTRFFKPEYLSASIFIPLHGDPRFEALREAR